MSAIMKNVDRGDTRTSTVTFTNPAGAVTNPATVTFKVINPTGPASQTSYVYGTATEVTRPSTGVYVLTLKYTISGTWEIRCEGTGTVEEATSGVVVVKADPFT